MVDSTVNLVFLYLLTAVTETHKHTDQLLLECCGAGSSFASRLLDRTVQTDLCLVLSKPAVYSSKLQKNKKKGGVG